MVNGFRFRTKTIESSKTTQNSGIMCKASTMSYASVKDKNPILGKVTYYGVLTDIINIYYASNMEYLLFRCDWVNNERGCNQDEFKFTLVNFDHVMYLDNLPTDEPFIFSTQAEQVWYVADPLEPSWKVIAKMTRRDNFVVYSRDPNIEPIIPQELDDRPLGDDRGGG
ncbi:hypothetical protein ACH5RR_018245 [Cinchona calisaya]|uniref:DUF4216 domain-containing protein n=1 Tax=Cinchona calisaya TaxID=153742 RepID=A0ABD2ZL07_9GENT